MIPSKQRDEAVLDKFGAGAHTHLLSRHRASHHASSPVKLFLVLFGCALMLPTNCEHSTQLYSTFSVSKSEQTNPNSTFFQRQDQEPLLGSSTNHPSTSDEVPSRTTQHRRHVPVNPPTNTSHKFRCPEQFGYFADVLDCSRYFVCVFGDPLHETCTGGLYFSSELQTCDWPQNVNCNHLSRQQQTNDLLSINELAYVTGQMMEIKKTNETRSYEEENPPTELPSLDYYSNDLDNPQFDESVASFVDQNGDFYVHDEPGGLYSVMERSSSISDHKKPIYEAFKTSYINSIEPKTQERRTSGARKKEYGRQLICQNCTRPNENVLFDDDVDDDDDSVDALNNVSEPVYEDSLTSEHLQKQDVYPEHLRPRINIVKKQLKDNKELSNLDETPTKDVVDVDQTKEKTSKSDKDQREPTPETTVFMANTGNDDYLNKRDLWNSKTSLSSKTNFDFSSSTSRNSDKMNRTLNGSSKHQNLYQTYRYSVNSSSVANIPISYKYRRSQKAGHSLTDDSIMQIFRGNQSQKDQNDSNAKQRKYLMKSFSIPFYSIHSNLNIAKIMSAGAKFGDKTRQNIANKAKSQTNHTTSANDAHSQIIFYSYRNRDQVTPGNHKTLPFSTTSGQSMYSGKTDSNNDDNGMRKQSDINQPEVFTIHYDDYLIRNTSTHSIMSNKHPKINRTIKMQAQNYTTSVPLLSISEYKTNSPNSTASVPKTNRPESKWTSHLAPNSYDDLSTRKVLTISNSTNTKQVESFNSSLFTHSKIDSSNFILPPSERQIPQCDAKFNCKLPKCFCSGTKIPNGLKRNKVPQMILLTFDGAINDINFPLYEEIFGNGKQQIRLNPNGCPIKSTFFVSHEWTDYGKVQTLYSRGHEIASHSITHSFGEQFSTSDWTREIAGQREILHRYAGIPKNEIKGMRAPFLQIGGDQQFQMLMDANFSYDSSISIFDNAPPFWPYTLDFAIQHDCMITPCPTRSYPGLWEIGLTMWHDLVGGGRCTMGNSCTSPGDADGVYELIMSNFKRHYHTNRAPFGLFYQSGWFTTIHHKIGFLKFVDEVLKLGDVYFVTNWQLLQWMQNPNPSEQLANFKPWKCSSNSAKVEECNRPNICHVKFHKKNTFGSRYFKTCQKCPTDYPWIDNVESLLAK